MDRFEIYKYLTEKLHVYSGIVQEYRPEEYDKMLDIRWHGDVHFVFVCNSYGSGWYWVERDGQRISVSYLVKKLQEKNITYMQHLIDDIESGRYHKKKTLKEAIRSIIGT